MGFARLANRNHFGPNACSILRQEERSNAVIRDDGSVGRSINWVVSRLVERRLVRRATMMDLRSGTGCVVRNLTGWACAGVKSVAGRARPPGRPSATAHRVTVPHLIALTAVPPPRCPDWERIPPPAALVPHLSPVGST